MLRGGQTAFKVEKNSDMAALHYKVYIVIGSNCNMIFRLLCWCTDIDNRNQL